MNKFHSPSDFLIIESNNEHQKRNNVKRAIAKERPPRQLENLRAENRAHSNHKQHIEHGTADDGADSHVGLCKEDA